MQRLTQDERKLIEPIERSAMLERTERWSAINSGTGNLAGLQRQAEELAQAFAGLPGELEVRERDALDDVEDELVRPVALYRAESDVPVDGESGDAHEILAPLTELAGV